MLGCNACFLNRNVNQKGSNQLKTDEQTRVNDLGIVMIPLTSFENDTINYLKTNIYQHKAFFIGKKLELLLDSLEIDVQTYFVNDNFNKPDSSKGIMLYFVDMNTLFLDKKRRIYKELSIEFESPVSFENAFSLMRKTNSKWTKESYMYHKDRIVKDVQMVNTK